VLLSSDSEYTNPAAAVVDLSFYPLTREALEEIGQNIMQLHGLAKDWSPDGPVNEMMAQRLTALLTKNPDLNPRTWVRSAVEVLDASFLASSVKD
jgi:hypothetical protein